MYPAIIAEVEEAISRVLPDVSVRRHARG
jgi:hypothetical protein